MTEDLSHLPKISRRQTIIHKAVELLGGDRYRHEPHLRLEQQPDGIRNSLLRLALNMQWQEADRLRDKYGQTTYRSRHHL